MENELEDKVNQLRARLGPTSIPLDAMQRRREYHNRTMREYLKTEKGRLARKKYMSIPENRLKVQGRRRQNYLFVRIDGKVKALRVNKRLYSGCCELCGVSDSERKLYYHHWDNTSMSKGLWLCRNCHTLAEVKDKRNNLIESYVELKNRIEEESKMTAVLEQEEGEKP